MPLTGEGAKAPPPAGLEASSCDNRCVAALHHSIQGAFVPSLPGWPDRAGGRLGSHFLEFAGEPAASRLKPGARN